ncbi:hypothetical protein D3C86_2052730 [compost metagenome]
MLDNWAITVVNCSIPIALPASSLGKYPANITEYTTQAEAAIPDTARATSAQTGSAPAIKIRQLVPLAIKPR